jgi:hypothetical protein
MYVARFVFVFFLETLFSVQGMDWCWRRLLIFKCLALATWISFMINLEQRQGINKASLSFGGIIEEQCVSLKKQFFRTRINLIVIIAKSFFTVLFGGQQAPGFKITGCRALQTKLLGVRMGTWIQIKTRLLQQQGIQRFFFHAQHIKYAFTQPRVFFCFVFPSRDQEARSY